MNKEDLLNGYFENSLSDEELNLFEELLQNNADFKAEFEFRKDLKSALQHSKRAELKEKLRKHETQNSNLRKLVFNWRYVAAAVLVLGFGSYFILNNLQNSNDAFTQYYETYPNVVSPVVRADSSDTSLEAKAFQAYENKDFKQAEILFSELFKTQQHEYALFYQAMSYLEIEGKTSDAISLLEKTEWSNEYKEKSLWYLAMAHLKMKNKQEAKKSLERLNELGNYRQEQVKQLLDQL